MKPMNDHVLIRKERGEVKSGGLIVVEGTVQAPFRGEVLAVGPGKDIPGGKRRPLQVQPGDRVFFARHAGAPVVVNGEELQLIREDNILAVIDPGAN